MFTRSKGIIKGIKKFLSHRISCYCLFKANFSCTTYVFDAGHCLAPQDVPVRQLPAQQHPAQPARQEKDDSHRPQDSR